MTLARFIQTEIEQLLEDRKEAAPEVAPQLGDEDSRHRKDHVRSMLEFIAEDLSTSRAYEESAPKGPASGINGKHGTDRLEQDLSILQMLQELRALRARVTRAWVDEDKGLIGKDIDELMRFNEAIDQLTANSVSDYSARREQETCLLETMLKASVDPAAIFDTNGKHRAINTSVGDLVNAPQRDVTSKTPLDLVLDLATELHDAITKTVTTGQTQRREFHHCLPFYFDCQFVPVFNDRNEIEAVVKTSRDITERKQTDYQVWQRANFDSLTGLPNRWLFIDRLEQILLEARREGSSFALLFIGLDRFKLASDQLGHEAADRLLAQMAERISTKVRAMDTVARLGGDEFALVLKETRRNDAKDAARELLTSLERAFDVDSHQVCVSGSVGLTLFPNDGQDVDQLMHNAGQAMRAAKELGGQQVQVYSACPLHR